MPTIIVALLVFLTVHEASGIGLRCRCINKEKRPIGRYIGAVEMNPASSHCKDTEIIATLKKDGQKVCLDPKAPWVKKMLERKKTQ
ncbi:C-X-C motif chemokine 2-like [Archocentrus centrarchus]|uniref:C-X-C motif chemokine 2-like n=1 Tax=Archocentrus centrarchus TaxID=63155 RepID=UPI0011E9EB32|nr:C-X-C motif chemokine 2-like [Archocentrus centrarchus]XP_030581192.1 C-X-C motif chemokine 2-like [Archocentrus centrarchus]XP_030585099.1 C-X-C motif chemokine 2-like [Archocentrus centrarchus]XP_030585109.1 C-X-C motif chemokine 2-like [Archocentrus centrarchus]